MIRPVIQPKPKCHVHHAECMPALSNNCMLYDLILHFISESSAHVLYTNLFYCQQLSHNQKYLVWPGNMGLTPSPLHLPLQCMQGWPAWSPMLLSQEQKFLQSVHKILSIEMVSSSRFIR